MSTITPINLSNNPIFGFETVGCRNRLNISPWLIKSAGTPQGASDIRTYINFGPRLKQNEIGSLQEIFNLNQEGNSVHSYKDDKSFIVKYYHLNNIKKAVGYVPVLGAFAGISHIREGLKTESRSEKIQLMVRGVVEIIGLGAIFLIADLFMSIVMRCKKSPEIEVELKSRASLSGLDERSRDIPRETAPTVSCWKRFKASCRQKFSSIADPIAKLFASCFSRLRRVNQVMPEPRKSVDTTSNEYLNNEGMSRQPHVDTTSNEYLNQEGPNRQQHHN